MTVYELITELEKHDFQMQVQIQVNENKYLAPHTVKKRKLLDAERFEEDGGLVVQTYVVIQYE